MLYTDEQIDELASKTEHRVRVWPLQKVRQMRNEYEDEFAQLRIALDEQAQTIARLRAENEWLRTSLCTDWNISNDVIDDMLAEDAQPQVQEES